MQQLSRLITSVIGEANDGVVAAEADTAAKRAALRDRLAFDDEAALEDAIDEYLAEAFPPLKTPPAGLLKHALSEKHTDWYLSNWEPAETAIVEDGIYVHPDGGPRGEIADMPPIKATLGIDISDDLEFTNGVALLTAEAVETVRCAVAERLRSERADLAAAVDVADLPRPIVESMEVRLPLTFDADLRVNPFDPAAGGSQVAPAGIGEVTTHLGFGRRGRP